MGAKGTDEIAVMMDSFRPLKVAKAMLAIEDPGYQTSWVNALGEGFSPPTS